jgi:trimethylamine--corrinoid protein Co-methyltransferase
MARLRASLLNDEERAMLGEQTLTVLEDVGVAIPVPEVLALLAANGATVDEATGRARIPRQLVARCLETVPDKVLLAARDPENDVVVGDGRLTFCTDGTATYVLDDETGRRHDGSAEAQRTFNRLFDALPNVDYIWPTISARDLDPVASDLEIQAIAFRSCAKHVQDEIRTPELVPPMLDIMAAVSGGTPADRPVYSQINCTLAPLGHDPEMTKASIALARAGVPIVIMPMPLMGTTAPMSIAGIAVISLAELLSAIVVFQLAAPGCPLIAAPEPGAADMRTGLYLCGAPEATLAGLVTDDMVVNHYGLPCEGLGFGGDNKAPDLQEGAEGMASALTAALLGVDTLDAIGTMDGAQMTSLAKVVLDNDTAGMVRTMISDVPMDAADALVDDIRAVGPGGHFLAQRSTRERGKDGGLWKPSVFRRETFEAHQGRALVQDALERAHEILETHEVTPLPDDVDAHIDEVIADTRRLLGAAAPS